MRQWDGLGGGARPPAGEGMPSPLSIWVRWSGREAAVFLRGDLDMATVAGAEARIRDVLAARPGRLVLDFARLSFMDSAGASLIISLRQRLEADVPVILLSPNRIVRKVLNVTGADRECHVQERRMGRASPRAAGRDPAAAPIGPRHRA